MEGVVKAGMDAKVAEAKAGDYKCMTDRNEMKCMLRVQYFPQSFGNVFMLQSIFEWYQERNRTWYEYLYQTVTTTSS